MTDGILPRMTASHAETSRVIHAELDGRLSDLETLERLFGGHETSVRRVGEQWVLYSPDLDARWASAPDAASIDELATQLLRDMNGIARALNFGFRLVRLTHKYETPDRAVHVMAVGPAVEMNVAASLTATATGGKPAPPQGPAWLAKASAEQDLAEVIEILGTPEEVDSFDMWKVFEIVRGQPHLESQLVSRGWWTQDELNSFKRCINDFAVSGSAARHRRANFAPTVANAKPIGLDQARELLVRLVRAWSESL